MSSGIMDSAMQDQIEGAQEAYKWQWLVDISNVPTVHEALMGFSEDSTENSACFLIEAILAAAEIRPQHWEIINNLQSQIDGGPQKVECRKCSGTGDRIIDFNSGNLCCCCDGDGWVYEKPA